jgi:hypothetical protein
MKKTIVAVVVTFFLTSILWIGIATMRIAVHELWLESAVKAPTGLALNHIKSKWDNHDTDSAKRYFEIFRKQWHAFGSEDGFMTNAMGDIMLKYSEEEQSRKSEPAASRNGEAAPER